VEAVRSHRPVAVVVGQILRPVAAVVVGHIPRPAAAVVVAEEASIRPQAAEEEADCPHLVAEAAANPTFVFSLRSAGCAGT
jgi:hypothetical protein